MSDLDALAELFKALSHPKRLAILSLLKGREMTVYEIMDALDLRQAYVSQQLMILRQVGLVCYRKEGWNVLYRIAQNEFYTLIEAAETIHAKLGVCAVAPEECEASARPRRRHLRCCGDGTAYRARRMSEAEAPASPVSAEHEPESGLERSEEPA